MDFGTNLKVVKPEWNNGMDKRAWNSGFSGMGKRAWNSGFQVGMGKRAWNSGFSGMGKRAWNSGFSGMGKRAWNSGFSGMGKRAWNSGFSGMGKRSPDNTLLSELGQGTQTFSFTAFHIISVFLVVFLWVAAYSSSSSSNIKIHSRTKAYIWWKQFKLII